MQVLAKLEELNRRYEELDHELASRPNALVILDEREPLITRAAEATHDMFLNALSPTIAPRSGSKRHPTAHQVGRVRENILPLQWAVWKACKTQFVTREGKKRNRWAFLR